MSCIGAHGPHKAKYLLLIGDFGCQITDLFNHFRKARQYLNPKFLNSFEVKWLPALKKGNPSLQSELIDAKLRAFYIPHASFFRHIFYLFSLSSLFFCTVSTLHFAAQAMVCKFPLPPGVPGCVIHYTH